MCTCSCVLAQEAPQLQQQWGKLFRASGGRLICGTCEDQTSLSSVSWGEGGGSAEDGQCEGWVGAVAGRDCGQAQSSLRMWQASAKAQVRSPVQLGGPCVALSHIGSEAGVCDAAAA